MLLELRDHVIGEGVALTLGEAHLQPYCAGSNRGLAPSHYVPRMGAVRRF